MRSRDSCYWMMSPKRQEIYLLLEDSRSLLSPSMSHISILLIVWNSLPLLFLIKKESSHFLSSGFMQMQNPLQKREEGWEREDWDSATCSLYCCHPVCTGESSIHQGLCTFSFFSLLFGVDADTQRDSTRNGSTLIIKGHPGLKLCWYILYPTPSWAAVLCSTIKAYMASSL